MSDVPGDQGAYLKRHFAKIVDDPSTAIPIGNGRINFSSLHYKFDLTAERAIFVRDWDSMNGTLLAVVISTGTIDRIEGTAVVVAPGVALCAAHVVKPHWSDIGNSGKSMNCVGAIDEERLQLWTVRHITLVGSSDLAILEMELKSPFENGGTLSQVAMSTRLPAVDEKLSLVGLRASAEGFERQADGIRRFSLSVIAAAGPVTAQYLNGRDRSMMPWPALEVDCPSWGGMSGGPVFDASGKLIGLLSSSFTATELEGPSYVSLVFPALVSRLKGTGWPAGVNAALKPLIELELCDVDRRNALRIHEEFPDGSASYFYDPW